MKTSLLCLALAVGAAPAWGQVGVKRLTKEQFTNLTNGKDEKGKDLAGGEAGAASVVNKGIDFGVSLGFSFALQKLYDAQISPLDNTLQITTVTQPSFLLSTGVAFPLARTGSKATYSAGGSFYRRTEGADAKPSATVYVVPYGWYALATVNLTSFNAAMSGSQFNTQLAGGLGLGYRFNDNVLAALTFEMISYRTPRDFLLADSRRNQVLTNPAGVAITSLTPTDTYFIDRYLPSVSFKLFYLIAYKPAS